ncbi:MULTISPECIES: DUF6226 family protein [Microbacterium]|uniref:DUF6226 family protein n=1 Tax=Microbacterium TaxID=33882 RepID=UPI00146CD1F6|nr:MULTISPECIES: DUF6226 family protein [Microbacterium]
MTHRPAAYVRPPIVGPTFHDAEGALIPYGNRWEGPPPEDTYSVDTHPERFAPIHAVADALIAHLRDAYDVEVTDDIETKADLIHPAVEAVRAVRIQPKDPASAPLTFVFTSYPGIVLHAGALHDFHYPSCGCDACDSTWEAEAAELERHVAAVVSGQYRESVVRRPRPWVAYSMTYPDGQTSGRGPAPDVPSKRLKAARRVLRDIPGHWAPWPQASPRS